jgi:hypothetical protein
MEDRSSRRLLTLVKERRRADIHDGPEHKTLQSEAGYIDARPNRQIDENLLRRTAGPYIRVIFDDLWARSGSSSQPQ